MKSPLKIVGIVLLLIVVVACFMFSGVFSNREASGAEDAVLGAMFSAVELDQNGCPVEKVTEFFPDETIYVGLDESTIPRGTSMFVRLYQNGQAVEDTEEITADEDVDSCVWFEFVPDGSFTPGQYEAELYVNGSPTNSVRFAVTGSAGGALPGEQAQFGRLYTSTQVDAGGCPVDAVSEFYADEAVYASLDESFIPAGTEMFARLVYEGQPVEDTQPIYADENVTSCVWFVFEPDGQGWVPGSYQVEVFADGGLVDETSFGVR